jgi:hypothetical protein
VNIPAHSRMTVTRMSAPARMPLLQIQAGIPGHAGLIPFVALMLLVLILRNCL